MVTMSHGQTVAHCAKLQLHVLQLRQCQFTAWICLLFSTVLENMRLSDSRLLNFIKTYFEKIVSNRFLKVSNTNHCCLAVYLSAWILFCIILSIILYLYNIIN